METEKKEESQDEKGSQVEPLAKKLYEFELKGCDDSTCFKMELTKDEFNLSTKIAKKSKYSSDCGCQPILKIRECE
jgi:hypothetical protein